MDIQRNGSQPPAKGNSDWFTGKVRIDSRFQGDEPARVGGAIVTFEPGARTAWHIHPLGQTLIVTAGCGWAQREGGPREEIRSGDIIWFAPGEKHWHGATATTCHGAHRHSGTARRQGLSTGWNRSATCSINLDYRFIDVPPLATHLKSNVRAALLTSLKTR
jgi:quercetin dioxygenase-like cupin family protein